MVSASWSYNPSAFDPRFEPNNHHTWGTFLQESRAIILFSDILATNHRETSTKHVSGLDFRSTRHQSQEGLRNILVRWIGSCLPDGCDTSGCLCLGDLGDGY